LTSPPNDDEIRKLKRKAVLQSTDNALAVEVVWLDFEGKFLRVWDANLERFDDKLIIVRSVAKHGMSFEYASFQAGDHCVQYFLRDKCFCIHEFRTPAGLVRYWFCHISQLLEVSASRIMAQDLILDVLVKPNGEYRLVDLDEFTELSSRIDSVLHQKIKNAREEILQMVRKGVVPFAGSIMANIRK
jgi:protein associated with RNAse G/E